MHPTIIVSFLRVRGSIKFDTVPGGGSKAGPSSKDCKFSAGVAISNSDDSVRPEQWLRLWD